MTLARAWPHAFGWRHLMLAVMVVAGLAAGIGLRDPSPPDEPRFALAARDMVHSGQWLFPHRGSEFYAEKPPVFMWLQALAYRATGDLQVAFLLPSLLAALLTLWFTWDLARRLWTPRAGRYAAMALFVCLQFGLQAKRGQIDMVLVSMTTLSLWALLRHLLQGPNWPLAWLGMFAAGLGTVTKGVGFLPVLVLLPWLAHRRRAQPGAWHGSPGDGWRWAACALAFIAGAAVWLAPMLVTAVHSSDPALAQYARELLLRQTGERYANAWHHVQPAWYYLQVMATLWLPGVLLAPWVLPAWWRRLRRMDARLWLLLGWSVLVLLFFSASPGKREVYLFPMLPALCVAAAPWLPGLLLKPGVRRTLAGYLLVVGLGACVMSIAAMAGWNDWAARLAAQRGLDPQELASFLAWMLGLGLAGLLLAMWAQLQRIGSALVMFTALLWIAYGLGFAPAVDADSSARELMQRVGGHIGPDAELGMLAWREQHLLQSDRRVLEFGFRNSWQAQWQGAGPWLRADPGRRWLFVLAEAVGPCVDASRTVAIGSSNRRDWVLVPGTALLADCSVPPLEAAHSP